MSSRARMGMGEAMRAAVHFDWRGSCKSMQYLSNLLQNHLKPRIFLIRLCRLAVHCTRRAAQLWRVP